MAALKCFALFLLIVLCEKSKGQQIILLQKDSLGNGKFQLLSLPNLGGKLDAACSILKIKIYTDTISTLLIKKCLVK
jgi:hypothetical protein